MLKDTYAMNKLTGEILPCMQAIHEYHKTHNHYLDNWLDEWEDTGIECENAFVEMPDFSKAIKI